MKSDIGYIYGLICPIDNSIRYVGKTSVSILNRLRTHKKEAIHGHKYHNGINQSHKYRWLKLLVENLLDSIKTVSIGVYPLEKLNDMEKYWIKHYKSLGFKLTNSNNGGDGKPSIMNGLTFERRSEISKRIYENNPAIKENLSMLMKNNKILHQSSHNAKNSILLNIQNGTFFEFKTCRKAAEFLGINSKLFSYINKNHKIFENWIILSDTDDLSLYTQFGVNKSFNKYRIINVLISETKTVRLNQLMSITGLSKDKIHKRKKPFVVGEYVINLVK